MASRFSTTAENRARAVSANNVSRSAARARNPRSAVCSKVSNMPLSYRPADKVVYAHAALSEPMIGLRVRTIIASNGRGAVVSPCLPCRHIRLDLKTGRALHGHKVQNGGGTCFG